MADTRRGEGSRVPQLDDALVVVVDDHEMVRTAMVTLLQALGRDALAYHSIDAGIDAAAGRPVSVVFLDWLMPGSSGDETLMRAERAWPEARIVLLSGNTSEIPKEAQERAFLTLEKPISLDALKELL